MLMPIMDTFIASCVCVRVGGSGGITLLRVCFTGRQPMRVDAAETSDVWQETSRARQVGGEHFAQPSGDRGCIGHCPGASVEAAEGPTGANSECSCPARAAEGRACGAPEENGRT